MFALFFDEKFCLLHSCNCFIWYNLKFHFFCAAELNDEPLYIVTNEGKLRDFYGQRPEMREAYDVYNPLENIHQHSDRINDQEETYIEPLDDNGKLDFYIYVDVTFTFVCMHLSFFVVARF